MRERELDQFYTKGHIAERCWLAAAAALRERGVEPELWVEPSAGAGAFLSLMPEASRRGFDIDPRAEGIEKADFLAQSGFAGGKSWAAAGNPPFGKNSSLALRFLNHCAAQGALAVAFILPRTFQKESLLSRVDHAMELAAEWLVPENSFEFRGEDRDVPCVMQVWVRAAGGRRAPLARSSLTHADYEFVTREQAQFAFQRVGAAAGKVSREFAAKAAPSHHFMRSTGERDAFEVLSGIDWRALKERTAGNPSISKADIAKAYEAALRGESIACALRPLPGGER